MLQLLAGIAAIAAGVTAILLVTAGPRSAVKEYVSLLREKKSSEAYGMLAGARKEDLTPDEFSQRLQTPLLSRSTGIDITASSTSGPGKGCVIASIEHPAGKTTVHFYVGEESGRKVIHSVLAGDELGTAVEPWPCD